MSSEKEWKTVKNGKKPAANGRVSLKKKLTDGMPRMEAAVALKETPTIYERFMREELRSERKMDRSGDMREVEVVRRVNKKLLNIHDAIEGLDEEEMAEIVSKGDQLTQGDQVTQGGLRDLSTFINHQLPSPLNQDPIFSNKAHNFPLSECEGGKEAWLATCLLQQRSDVVVLDCLDHCIDFLISAVYKEQASMGYRLIIQLILKKRPHLIISRIQKYDQLLQRHSSRPLKSLLVLWSFAQAGYSSIINGLNIWFGLMFSQINVKSVNVFVIEFLERLLKVHRTESSRGTVSKTDYFKFFSEAFSTQSLLSESLKQRMKLLHPAIKQVAWSEGDLSSFFIGYLSRCHKDCPEEKKAQLLSMATECLLKGPKSFDAWNNKLPKYLSQSAMLLEDILTGTQTSRLVGSETRWKVSGVHKLMATLRALKVEIKEEEDEERMNDVESCLQLIQAMKMKSRKRDYIFFLLLLTPFFLFIADLHCNGTLQETQTVHMWRVVGGMTHEYLITSSQHYKWLAKNGYSGLKESLCEWPKRLRVHSHQASKQLSDKLPLLLEHLSKTASHCVHILCSVCHHTCCLLHASTLFLSQQVFTGDWSVESFKGEMIKLTTIVAHNMQHLLNNLNNYTQNLWNNFNNSMHHYLHSNN